MGDQAQAQLMWSQNHAEAEPELAPACEAHHAP